MSIVDRLALEGHDSELFTFLHPKQIGELRSHPSANTPLWTFGSTYDLEIDPPIRNLSSVASWNSRPQCLAFTERPNVDQCEPHNGKPSEWQRYRGFTTNEPLIQVTAIVLVRYFFCQGFTASLDDRPWIPNRADPQLERLAYIRTPKGRDQRLWYFLKADYFAWAFVALNQVPRCAAGPDLSSMVDRCITEGARNAG